MYASKEVGVPWSCSFRVCRAPELGRNELENELEGRWWVDDDDLSILSAANGDSSA